MKLWINYQYWYYILILFGPLESQCMPSFFVRYVEFVMPPALQIQKVNVITYSTGIYSNYFKIYRFQVHLH